LPLPTPELVPMLNVPAPKVVVVPPPVEIPPAMLNVPGPKVRAVPVLLIEPLKF
jgi:hypothetical protein